MPPKKKKKVKEKETKKSPKKETKKAPPKRETSPIGTKELAEKLGTTPKNLRNFLRTNFEHLRQGEYTVWGWSKWTDPQLKEIMSAWKNRDSASVKKEKPVKKDKTESKPKKEKVKEKPEKKVKKKKKKKKKSGDEEE